MTLTVAVTMTINLIITFSLLRWHKADVPHAHHIITHLSFFVIYFVKSINGDLSSLTSSSTHSTEDKLHLFFTERLLAIHITSVRGHVSCTLQLISRSYAVFNTG